jgi:hypothetical protein
VADFKPDFLGYNFIWFMGVVEDRDDPLKLGRVKIRCFGWHPKDKEELPTEGLPWAQTIQPVTAPSAPSSGLTEGTWVFGFFIDGEDAQRPMVVGQVPGYRFDSEGKNGESELPRAGRVEENYPSPQSEIRKKQRIEGIAFDVFKESTWDEPEEPADKAYPYVQTVSSEAGFITETVYGANTARQVTYDTTGGYDERKSPSGDKVVKVIGDNYELVCGSSYMYVKGDINLTVDGSVNQNIAKDYTLVVGGDYYLAVGGNKDVAVTKVGTYTYGLGRVTDILSGGDITSITGATRLSVIGGGYRLSAPSGSITLTSGTVTAAVINGTTAVTAPSALGATISLGTHKHLGVTTGLGISGGPTI